MPAKNAEATVEDMIARARAQRDLDTAPPWMPEDNQELIGTVVGFRVGHTDDYGDYPVVIYRKADDNTLVAFHAFHTIARDNLKDVGTKIGSNHLITKLPAGKSNKRKDPVTGEPQTYYPYSVIDLDKITDAPATPEVFPF